MEHQMIKNLIIAFCFTLLISSCYYDKESDLYPSTTTTNCDSIKGQFALEVKPLIDNQCKSCHNGNLTQGGINLDGYDNVKNATLNGKVLETIRHDNGVSPMPQGTPKLSDCDIKKVTLWKTAGAPNN